MTRVNALGARKPVIGFERIQIFFAGQRAFGFGLDENVLQEVGHLFLFVAFVELDDVFQGMDCGVGTAREIGVEIGFQFVEQHRNSLSSNLP